MKTSPLPRIPLNASFCWRLFRERIVPIIMFSSLLGIAYMLWSQSYGTPTLAGVGVGVNASVASPQAGYLKELKVKPYQLVNKGDPIAIIEPVDVRVQLDLLRTELDLARLQYSPSLAHQNAMNYERVRVEFLRLQTELAVVRINLERAEDEVRRNRRLYEEKILSEDLYELSVKTRDALAAEVEKTDSAVTEIGQRMAELQSLGDPGKSSVDERLLAVLTRLDAARAEAASNWGPITVVAPISGMVSGIIRQAGEYVLDGELIVGVSSLGSDRVVAYLRQPYPLDPEVGMKVRLVTRTGRREQFSTSLIHVGAQVEVITNVLAMARASGLSDFGLPVVVGVPDQHRIRPGEIVDVWIDR